MKSVSRGMDVQARAASLEADKLAALIDPTLLRPEARRLGSSTSVAILTEAPAGKGHRTGMILRNPGAKQGQG